MRFNGAINDFFDGSGVRASPEPAQYERKRLCPRLHFVDLEADFYESVVHDHAISKIGLIAFASLSDFTSESLQVAMASLQISFSGLGVGKSGHGVPFKQVIAPETAHSKNGQLLELSGEDVSIHGMYHCSTLNTRKTEVEVEHAQLVRRAPLELAKLLDDQSESVRAKVGFRLLDGVGVIFDLDCGFHGVSFQVDGSEQSQKGQQGPKKGARKGCIPKGLQSPQEGFTVFAALLVVTVVFCYHFCSVEN